MSLNTAKRSPTKLSTKKWWKILLIPFVSPALSYWRIVIMVLIVCGGGLWWWTRGNVCGLPIKYRLGQIDKRFGLTEEQTLLAIGDAERWWEANVGYDLFQYQPDVKPALTFNLVYDSRQQTTQELQRIENERGVMEKEMLDLANEYKDSKNLYERYAAMIVDSKAIYENRLQQYKQTIEEWNSRGGAPTNVYNELERERKGLDDYRFELNALIDQRNDLADRINQLADTEEQAIGKFNDKVQYFNETFVADKDTEDEQGIYSSGTINMYQFNDRRDLIMLLAHEMGHALGLDHDNDPMSVMYPKKNDRQTSGNVYLPAVVLQTLTSKCNLK
jgi:hypothetical protein